MENLTAPVSTEETENVIKEQQINTEGLYPISNTGKFKWYIDFFKGRNKRHFQMPF